MVEEIVPLDPTYAAYLNTTTGDYYENTLITLPTLDRYTLTANSPYYYANGDSYIDIFLTSGDLVFNGTSKDVYQGYPVNIVNGRGPSSSFSRFRVTISITITPGFYTSIGSNDDRIGVTFGLQNTRYGSSPTSIGGHGLIGTYSFYYQDDNGQSHLLKTVSNTSTYVTIGQLDIGDYVQKLYFTVEGAPNSNSPGYNYNYPYYYSCLSIFYKESLLNGITTDPAPSEYSLLYRIWQTVVDILAQFNPIHLALNNILNAIQALTGGFTAPPDVAVKASEAVGAMESARNDIDSMTDEIDGLTTRPPPEEIMPTLASDVYNPSDPAAMVSMAAVGEIMGHPAILPLLLSVFALAFIRYVIFGKAE